MVGSLGGAECASCGTKLEIRDGVAISRDPSSRSYFDDVFEIMRIGNHAAGTWEIFYQEQAKTVERSIQPGEVVVDIGCGPELPYRKNGGYVIGVDPSFHSIRANQAVDLRLFASAAELPLASGVVDAIVCFYSIHHMTGNTIAESRRMVGNAFNEFARILKPTGRLMIFDLSPWSPFGALENFVWNAMRRKLGKSLDMFFWKTGVLQRFGSERLPNASFCVRRFNTSIFRTFPPIFSKPSIRVPRLIYPFDINLYQWQKSGSANS